MAETHTHDKFATDLLEVEGTPNNIADRFVGRFFVPLSDPLHRMEGRHFGGPKEVECVEPSGIVGRGASHGEDSER